ncbi:hypothetical protein [Acinetobacter amyesii]|uniref:hypothetical protein n=1 Tax=Acinetobacter amyesii TaxID=2942470 RepID=UPI003F0B6D12
MERNLNDIEQIFENKINQLASIQHEIWAHWQSYLHSQCIKNEDGSLKIPAELVKHWESQIDTNYEDLSEEEKNSDLDQVLKFKSTVLAMLSDAKK